MSSVGTAKAGLDFIEKIAKLLEKMRNYKPSVKSLRVNYLDKNTEIKLLLDIPQGVRRRVRKVEIPAYPGYVIHEVFEGNTLNRIGINWRKKGSNWVADANELTASDKYFVIMRGSISQGALDELVKLYCPEDPRKTPELDLYWIDSAIKDMAILERIYDELNIDKVTTCVNVGLERQFSSSVPYEMKEYLKARARADIYLASTDRQKAFKSFYRLRLAQRRLGKLAPQEIYRLGSRIVSPEQFMYFVAVDKPFRINAIVPVEGGGIYPEKIGVRVQTDLNYRIPVAQGDLKFKKVEFATKLKEEISSLPGLPKELRSKLKWTA